MTSRSTADRPYLSIGEVLGLLLEEFPDVTISKIRFLESQGLIEPERTASGYRKFYDEDVELLRYILREQKEHFLPLRVIKDRLETPPAGLDRPPPRGIKNVSLENERDETDVVSRRSPTTGMTRPSSTTGMSRPSTRGLERPRVDDETMTRGHPAAQRNLRSVADETRSLRREVTVDPLEDFDGGAAYTRREIVAMTGCEPELVRELERFGMLRSRRIGDETVFGEQDVAICELATAFVEAGIDIRHLRAWKTAADREAGLFEQRVLPVLRRRSPEARRESDEILDELSELGARLRAILLERALSSLRDGR